MPSCGEVRRITRSRDSRFPAASPATAITLGARVCLAIVIGLTARWLIVGMPLQEHDGRLATLHEKTIAKVDVNRCDWPELCLLPGISETLARRIVGQRQARGAFRSPADLEQVPGIGAKTVRRLLSRIEFSGAPGQLRPGDSTSLRSLEWKSK
ncbi:MAG: helix-hairpin-helix domain-containing protein [Planctomycetales bacterium]|nr:helix-hairpin-helix domain-containing protein [Planctomycetales bacterium]